MGGTNRSIDADRLAAQAERDRRQRDFEALVDRIADGEEPAIDEIRQTLDGCGRTAVEMQNSVRSRQDEKMKQGYLARFEEMRAKAAGIMVLENARLDEAKRLWESKTDFARRVLAYADHLTKFGLDSTMIQFLNRVTTDESAGDIHAQGRGQKLPRLAIEIDHAGPRQPG
jgi:hypothetical protein